MTMTVDYDDPMKFDGGFFKKFSQKIKYWRWEANLIEKWLEINKEKFKCFNEEQYFYGRLISFWRPDRSLLLEGYISI